MASLPPDIPRIQVGADLSPSGSRSTSPTSASAPKVDAVFKGNVPRTPSPTPQTTGITRSINISSRNEKLLEGYKNNPQSLKEMQKGQLFKQLTVGKVGKEIPGRNLLPETQIDHLLHYVTDATSSNKIDLSHPDTLRTIGDFLKYGQATRRVFDDVVQVLENNKPINDALLEICLDYAIAHKDEKDYDAAAMTLMTLYSQSQSQLPLDNPKIMSVMTMLLDRRHGETPVKNLVENFFQSPNLNVATFEKFLTVFENKQEKGNVAYQARDLLVKGFNSNAEIRSHMAEMPPSTIVYLSTCRDAEGHGADIPEDILQKAKASLPVPTVTITSVTPMKHLTPAAFSASRSPSPNLGRPPETESASSSRSTSPLSVGSTSTSPATSRPTTPEPLSRTPSPSEPRPIVKNETLDKYMSGTMSKEELKKFFEQNRVNKAVPEGNVSVLFSNRMSHVELDKKQPAFDHMLLYVSGAYQKGSKDIDLSHPNCCKLLQDAMRELPEDRQDDIATWMTKNWAAEKPPRPNAPKVTTWDTVAACLTGLVERNKEGGAIQRSAIHELLKMNSRLKPPLPATHPSMVAITAILLAESRYVNQAEVTAMVKAISADKGAFTIDTFLDFAAACSLRGTAPEGTQEMIAAFNSRADLKGQLQERMGSVKPDVLAFLKANGADL